MSQQLSCWIVNNKLSLAIHKISGELRVESKQIFAYVLVVFMQTYSNKQHSTNTVFKKKKKERNIWRKESGSWRFLV